MKYQTKINFINVFNDLTFAKLHCQNHYKISNSFQTFCHLLWHKLQHSHYVARWPKIIISSINWSTITNNDVISKRSWHCEAVHRRSSGKWMAPECTRDSHLRQWRDAPHPPPLAPLHPPDGLILLHRADVRRNDCIRGYKNFLCTRLTIFLELRS